MTARDHGVVWLASFPKSGNTWLRLLLANLLYADEQPVDINHITLPGSSPISRHAIEALTLIDTSLLTHSEVDRLRPQWTRLATADATERSYIKTHDLWRLNAAGEPILGRLTHSVAMYVVRDPRDVAVSLSHHFGCSLDKAIGYLNDGSGDAGRVPRRYAARFDSVLYSWSQHVSSWLEQREVPVHLLRYEDLLANGAAAFAEAVAFLGLDVPAQAIERAVHFAAFDQLQRQEQTHGFREKLGRASAPFFRSGRAGAWSEVLSPAQQERIVCAHRPLMERLGYL